MSAVADVMRRRREELGMSLAEVQAAIRIHRRYLGALEAGRVGEVPGGEAYAAGFLRAYANFLGLDGAALLAEFRREEAAAKAAASGPAGGGGAASGTDASGPGAEKRRWAPGLTAGVAGVVLLAAAGGALVLRGRPAPRATGPAAVSTRTPAAVGGAGASGSRAAGGLASSAHPATGAGSTAVSRAPSAAAPPAVAAVAPPPPTRAHVSVSASTGASGLVTYTVRGASSLTVAVRASAPCWFRIWPDSSASFAEGTLPAGGAARWTATGRLQVRLGFPEGVRLTVDGVALLAIPQPSPVDLVFVRAPAP